MIAAVIFDFDGVVLDSETPEFESHRRVYERCGVPLAADEWCDQIGLYVEGEERRWFERLCERSSRAPTEAEYDAERRRLFQELLSRADARHP